MFAKLAFTAAALTLAAGTIAFAPRAFHKAADLATADNTMLTLASPEAIASPDAQAKLASVGASLQKVAGIATAPKPQDSQWTSVDKWGQQ